MRSVQTKTLKARIEGNILWLGYDIFQVVYVM